MSPRDLPKAATDAATRAHFRGMIGRHRWGPIEALNHAADTEAEDRLVLCLIFTRLCADPIARADPTHPLLHRGYGIPGCPAGDAILEATRISLGISQARAAALVARHDQEMRAMDGLAGGA